MIEALSDLWTLLLTVVGGLNAELRTTMLAVLLSLGGTQFVKAVYADLIRPKRRRALQLTAFVLAAAPVAAAHPTQSGLLLAALAGVLSPTLYQVLLYVVDKRWPDLACALSSDHPDYSVADFMSRRPRDRNEKRDP